MKLSEVKAVLGAISQLTFELSDGSLVPEHFHVTEVGMIDKKFIDCGGKIRNEKVVSFQLWSSADTDHRLRPSKLIDIISLSEKVLHLEDCEVEVEFQSDTIGKYGLDFQNEHFVLTSKQTDCLAKDKCGIPEQKERINIADVAKTNSCAPGGKCC